jgi:hypothetical protein
VSPASPVTTAEAALTVVGDTSGGSLLITINGGAFAGRHGLQTTGTSPNLSTARINILGGDFVGNLAPYDLGLANPDIITTVFGEDFQLNGSPIGFGPLVDVTGTLSGTLADGSDFEWTFQRLNDAPLVLATVPEPTGLALLAIGGAAVLRRTRR